MDEGPLDPRRRATALLAWWAARVLRPRTASGTRSHRRSHDRRVEPLHRGVRRRRRPRPRRVWALVTDLPRMASGARRWSAPFVRGGARSRLGTRALNINRRGPLVWPTRSKVVRFEPHREFAFRVKDNNTIWSFTLEPTATGTRVDAAA